MTNQYSQDVIRKGDELIEKFKDILNIRNDMRPGPNPFAVRCAICLCDEMIGEYNKTNDRLSHIVYENEPSSIVHRLSHWQSVKSYLQSLK